MTGRGKALGAKNAVLMIDDRSHVQVLVGIDASDDVRSFWVFGHSMILSCGTRTSFAQKNAGTGQS